jgi:hypothetical protein
MGSLQSTLNELVRLQQHTLAINSGVPQPQMNGNHSPAVLKSGHQVEPMQAPGFALDPYFSSPQHRFETSVKAVEMPSSSTAFYNRQLSPPNLQTAISSQPITDDEDDSDPLIPASIDAPWDKMLSLAEAARLKADGHVAEGEDPMESAAVEETRKAAHPFDYTVTTGNKRRRGQRERHDSKGVLPGTRGDHIHAFVDAVEAGFVTEKRGRELFDLYGWQCS